MISLTGRGNIKAAATTANLHQRRRWLSDWQAPTPRATTRPTRRQLICLSGMICSNYHSALDRYQYNAGINNQPPLSSRMPIAGEFKCLQRTEHHGSHLDSAIIVLIVSQAREFQACNYWKLVIVWYMAPMWSTIYHPVVWLAFTLGSNAGSVVR